MANGEHFSPQNITPEPIVLHILINTHRLVLIKPSTQEEAKCRKPRVSVIQEFRSESLIFIAKHSTEKGHVQSVVVVRFNG